MEITLKNVTKYYDGKEILHNINLEIKNVNSVGIIGESGCGKSTLLRQLSGIELVDKGTVLVNGIKITKNNLKKYQNEIGYVFQKHNLFPHITIRENIMLILEKIKKMEKNEAKKRCDEVLDEFFLTDIANQIPSKVSGGQAQRASIARAIATNPDILFLDEPTAALDPLLTKEVLDSIKILKNKGVEFIFVTHEMEFLKKFADYYVYMDKGQIVEHGTINILYNPKTEKLKNFLSR